MERSGYVWRGQVNPEMGKANNVYNFMVNQTRDAYDVKI